MPEEKFRLPKSSYEELVKIILAYSKFTKEESPGEISEVAAIHLTIVSRNNGFLLETGIVVGGNKKMLTDKGKELARALEYEHNEDIQKCWKEIVDSNVFLQKLVDAVKIRRQMEPSTLQAHVAYTAGLAKNPTVMTGARTVLDIIKAAGLIEEKDGKIVATSEKKKDLVATDIQVDSGQQVQQTSEIKEPIDVSHIPNLGDKISLVIQIQIQCSTQEVEHLGPKLQKMIKSFSEQKGNESYQEKDEE